MSTPARLACLVPFCRCTRGQRKGERPIKAGEQWICGKHWRLVPVEMKRRRRELLRRWRKVTIGNRGKAEYLARVAYWRQWEAIKVMAIEVAAGITAPRKSARRTPPKSRARRPL